MKIMLLFPGISGIGFNSYGKGMEESWISHGLCSISAYAKKEGFTVELIDLRCLENWSHFNQIIIEKKPDVVGITMMSVDYNPAIKSIKIIKKASPHTIVVVGGPHPTIMLEEIEKEKNIDHIITGEGEISFTGLLKNIEKGDCSPIVIKGVVPEDLDKLLLQTENSFRIWSIPFPLMVLRTPLLPLSPEEAASIIATTVNPPKELFSVKSQAPQSCKRNTGIEDSERKICVQKHDDSRRLHYRR